MKLTRSSSTAAAAKKKDNPNVFLDNLGSFFLAGVGLLVASLIRSYMSSNNRNRARERLHEQSSLDPLEIDDLRIANSELTLAVYRKILQDLLQNYPSKTLTYNDFVKSVRTTMSGLKGDAFTIELGHLIDRVVVAALQQHGQTTEDPQPMAFWFTVLSLALAAPVPDRIQALYEVLKVAEDERVTLTSVRAMVGFLQDTSQLAPDSQVIESGHKYPVQHYDRASSGDLFEWDGTDDELIDIDAFASILRSKAVCAWGECYHKKKYV